MIVLWKINRRVLVDDNTLKELIKIQSIKTKEEATDDEHSEQVEALLIDLLNSKGLKLPMASTVLHFFNKDCFPIIDQRAYRVIYKKDYKEGTSVPNRTALYMDYLKKCINYYEQNLKDTNIVFLISINFFTKLIKKLEIKLSINNKAFKQKRMI